ncbi:MAG: F420-dependent methylenetetrahydromethanopterin dehydrogenase [Promethearchaeota archaeon]|nr:MAG: F420-dependent methylenetetrahydromethanopterin dehydrogenase [Candidatus Lokiarchaeota archaeon]
MSDLLKIGVLKNGTIGSSLLLSFLIDERAEGEKLEFREVTSGPKMHPAEYCVETMKELLEYEPDLILMSSPNAALGGPKKARELAGDIPTIVISDAPTKKAKDEIKEKGMGYIIVNCDSMIGARRPFLDPVEMSFFNSNLLKVLAGTGALKLMMEEINKVIMDLLEGKTPTLPQITIKADNATERAEFSNPYARAKAIAAFEIAEKVSQITGKACFVMKERENYMPQLAAAHEMMREAAELVQVAREIEKSNNTVVRVPHHKNQYLLKKTKLIEKEEPIK